MRIDNPKMSNCPARCRYWDSEPFGNLAGRSSRPRLPKKETR
jgi:hypothetical protein